jgi:hypothetical protein
MSADCRDFFKGEVSASHEGALLLVMAAAVAPAAALSLAQDWLSAARTGA